MTSLTLLRQNVKKAPVTQTANSASGFMNRNIGKSMAGTAPINQWNPGMSAGGVKTAAAKFSASVMPQTPSFKDQFPSSTRPTASTAPVSPQSQPTQAAPNLGLLNRSAPTTSNADTSYADKYNIAQGTATGYSASKGNAASYESQGYNPNTVGANGKAMVEDRLKGLLDGNSDYLKQARTEGLQQANARGLLNTTMAARAAEGAAIERALPIAQQDASTMNQRDLANMEAENRASEFGANATNQANQFNAGNQQSMSLANMEAENRSREYNATNSQNMALTNMEAQNKLILSKLDIESRTKLQEQEKQWQGAIQADANASASYNQYLQQFFEINNNKDMTTEQKNAGVAAITRQFDTYLQFTNKLRNL